MRPARPARPAAPGPPDNLDVTIEGDGTVVLVETDVAAKELPKEVRRAVEHRYPGASVRGTASVKKGAEAKKKADYYEFYLWTADQRPALVKVDPKGKVLEPEAKTAATKRDKKVDPKGKVAEPKAKRAVKKPDTKELKKG